jgi:hypothetical protein
MKNEDLVKTFLEKYFGHNLFETIDDKEVQDAIISLNELTAAVNNYFNIEEEDDSIKSRTGILGDRGVTNRTGESNSIVNDLHAALKRRGMTGIPPKEFGKLVLGFGLRGGHGPTNSKDDEDV